MNDTQVNLRQTKILSYLFEKPRSTRADIEQALVVEQVSRITVIRDLNYLIKNEWITQSGGGKYITYSLKQGKEILIPINIDKYFETKSDDRNVKYPTYNPSVIDHLSNLFTGKEIDIFEQGKKKLKDRFKNLDKSLLKRELERFTIELSWKSSQIEGNTYSLLETEELIKNKREAKGHDSNEAIMILNHKSTFDVILDKKGTFKGIGVSDIRAIHAELVKGLGISTGLRLAGVGITGTKYTPLDNKWQLNEALQAFANHIDKLHSVPEQALALLTMIAYIQPFNDGNKRTSRMASNAILLANGYYPLSYRSVDEVEYKKALILFYEQNNIYHLKQIFVEQQQFAIDNYFA